MTDKLLCYDLHSHTTASDGLLTPADLVRRAALNHVDVLAITDHDTVAGLAEAQATIMAEKLPLHLINGVEISTYWHNIEIHIVGLKIAIDSPELGELLQKQALSRRERAIKIDQKLARLGIMKAYQQAQVYAQGEIVSRAHFARFLVDSGQVKDVSQAFKKYLGRSGMAYVPPIWCSVIDAVQQIHVAGGLAVVAHPTRYGLTQTKLKKLLTDFKQAGGEAIEVSQSRQSVKDFNLLSQYANNFALLASQGSDFHNFSDYLDLGKTEPLSKIVKPIWYNWPENKQ